MPQNIVLNVAVKVDREAAWTVSRALEVDATDRIHVSIPAGTAAAPPAGGTAPPAGRTPTKVTVKVQPSGTGKVKLLVITSDVYDQKDLTYQLPQGAAPLALDAAQVWAGAGLVNLLGGALEELEFANATATPAAVTIFVGRDAT